VFFFGDGISRRKPRSGGAGVKFTLWTLGLLALVAAVYFVRARIGHHGERKSKDQHAAERRRSRADADRRDIQDLVTKLRSSDPDAEADAAAAAVREASPAPRSPRARVSSEASHGHDPDLPAPRSSKR
jgi:hypothetical protein